MARFVVLPFYGPLQDPTCAQFSSFFVGESTDLSMVSLIHHEDLMIKPKDHPDDATTSFLTGLEKERNASAFASFLHLVRLGTRAA